MHDTTHTLSNQDGPDGLGLASSFRPVTARDYVMVRAASEDCWPWLAHVTPVGGCTQLIRLAGAIQ